VASLGWVSPGAATEGVTVSPLFIFCWKNWRPFLLTTRFYSGVTPGRVSPLTFFTCPTSFVHYSL